jgi:hypothetical protein
LITPSFFRSPAYCQRDQLKTQNIATALHLAYSQGIMESSIVHLSHRTAPTVILAP